MRCIMCGTVLDENAEFCSECGAKQNTNSKKLETVEKTEEKSETKVCPVCGEVMILTRHELLMFVKDSQTYILFIRN